MKKIGFVLSIISLISLTGCFLQGGDDTGDDFDVAQETIDTDVFSNRDVNETVMYTQIYITLESGKDIEISEEGSYIISGNVTDTQIKVNTEDKVQIIFQNVTIINNELACLYVSSADKVFVRLDGVNTLSSNVTNDQDDNVNGVIFSRDDLTFNGDGILNLSSTTNGIVVKDDLIFTNGTYNITTTLDAVEVNDTLGIKNSNFEIVTNDGYNSKLSDPGSAKGLKCDDFIYIESGNFNINTYDDAIHSDGNIIIDGGEYIILTNDDAITSDYSVTINDGIIDINYCYEGLEGQRVHINGGEIYIDSYDDGINAAKSDTDDGKGCYINISNGMIIITIINISSSPEADGLDSNGDILITGGYILIHGTTNTRDTPLDYDGSAYIQGGTFLTTGSYSMTQQNFNSSNTTQGAIAYQISSSSYTSAGTVISLKDSSGNTVVEYTSVNKFQIVHISHEDIKEGETYTLYIGSTSYTIKMSSITYSNFSSSTGMPGRP